MAINFYDAKLKSTQPKALKSRVSLPVSHYIFYLVS